jgi:hypothetical protein
VVLSIVAELAFPAPGSVRPEPVRTQATPEEPLEPAE